MNIFLMQMRLRIKICSWYWSENYEVNSTYLIVLTSHFASTATALIVYLYTIQYCGYCTFVKETLKTCGIEYHEYDITGRRNSKARANLEQKLGSKRFTLPQIFSNDRYIGGATELKKLYDENPSECLSSLDEYN